MAGTSGQTRKSIVVDFSVMNADAVSNIQALNKELDKLKVRQLQLKAAKEQDSEEYVKNAAAIKQYSAALRANEQELQRNVKAQLAEDGSLEQMRATLASLEKQYAALGKEERESAAGKELLDRLNEQRYAVENLEHSFGDFTRQVGSYHKGVQSLLQPLTNIREGFMRLSDGTGKVSVALANGGKAVAAFSKQLLKLMMNPIVALIAAIVAVVMKLVQAFKANDDAMNALQKAFASFQPIIDAINNAFQWLVEKITKVIEGFSKLAVAFANLFGADAGKAVEDAQSIAQGYAELEEAENEYIVKHAENENKIKQLRADAADTSKTLEERKAALKEALKLEEESYQYNAAIANKTYQLRKRELDKKKALSNEEKRELAELQAAAISAGNELLDFQKSINKQLGALEKQIQSEQKQAAQEAEVNRKEREKKELDERRKTEDLLIEMMADSLKKQIKLLENTYNRQIEDIRKRLKEEKNLTVKARQELNNQIAILEKLKNQKITELNEKARKEEIQKQLEHEKKMADLSIQMMSDGYRKRLITLNRGYKQEFDTINNQITELEQKIANTSDENEKQQLVREKTRLLAYLQQLTQVWAQNNAKLVSEQKKTVTEMAKENILNATLSAIDNSDLISFEEKEVLKSQILQREAEERLNIALNEQKRLQQALANDPTNLELQEQYQQATAAVIQAQNDVAKAIKDTNTALDNQKIKAINDFTTIANSLGNVLSAFEGLFNEMAEGNEKYQKFATAMALSQIYVSMATAIAQAVQAAVQAGGFTGPAAVATIPAFIAELVGIVVSTIGSTISTLNKAKSSQPSAPKFATGGYIDEGQSGVDRVPIMATRGEYVIRKSKVDELGVDFFDKINFGKALHIPNFSGHYAQGGIVNNYQQSFDTEAMKDVLVEALKEMPNPIVDVRQITDQQRRVAIKQQIAKN